MKIVLLLLVTGSLCMASSQWEEYQKECHHSGGKAYKTKNDRFECKMYKQTKSIKNKKIIQKKTMKGPEYKDGISAFISAEF
jgi:hypothetical protein